MICFFDHPHADEAAAVATVGGKGASLWIIRSLGLRVPPGFTISIERSRRMAEHGLSDADRAAIDAALGRLEAETGRRLGDPASPLLLSVRSGAAASMPGMMDTLLNIGATPAVLAALAAEAGPEFAAEVGERAEAGLALLAAAGTLSVARGDARQLLEAAILSVAASWHGPRARAYRARMGLDEAGGTAVTVQAMVFGNRCDRSATGVAFSRCPDTGHPGARGDLLFRAQGEDVVAGRRRTQPLAALRERLPGAAAELDEALGRLEARYRDLVDVEFTIESGRLFILQARRGKRSAVAAARIARDLCLDPRVALTRREALARVPLELLREAQAMKAAAPGAAPLAIGVPASPGLATGPVALSAEEAVGLADGGASPILVRAETSPADVHGMAVSAGVLTSLGGTMSHAALVAREFGIPAVVGCADMRLADGGVEICGRTFRPGDTLTIDGGSGAVFAGMVEGRAAADDAVATLLSWHEEDMAR